MVDCSSSSLYRRPEREEEIETKKKKYLSVEGIKIREWEAKIVNTANWWTKVGALMST